MGNKECSWCNKKVVSQAKLFVYYQTAWELDLQCRSAMKPALWRKKKFAIMHCVFAVWCTRSSFGRLLLSLAEAQSVRNFQPFFLVENLGPRFCTLSPLPYRQRPLSSLSQPTPFPQNCSGCSWWYWLLQKKKYRLLSLQPAKYVSV